MAAFEGLVKWIMNYTTSSVRRFTAFVFLVYVTGVLVGIKSTMYSQEIANLTWMIPLLLALLSYVYADIAFFFFIIFVAIIYLLGV